MGSHQKQPVHIADMVADQKAAAIFGDIVRAKNPNTVEAVRHDPQGEPH